MHGDRKSYFSHFVVWLTIDVRSREPVKRIKLLDSATDHNVMARKKNPSNIDNQI